MVRRTRQTTGNLFNRINSITKDSFIADEALRILSSAEGTVEMEGMEPLLSSEIEMVEYVDFLEVMSNTNDLSFLQDSSHQVHLKPLDWRMAYPRHSLMLKGFRDGNNLGF